MTGIIADSMYEFFVENDALPVDKGSCHQIVCFKIVECSGLGLLKGPTSRGYCFLWPILC